MRRLLVIAAHPDDEVLGCGGLIAQTLRRGGEVRVIVLTEGCSAQYPDQPEMVERKLLEAQSAMRALAGSEAVASQLQWRSLGHKELSLESIAPAELNAPLRQQVVQWQPHWVLVHHSGDLNRDHRHAHEAARVACRPTEAHAPRLLSYETLSSTEWGSVPFVPNCFVPLSTEEIEAKVGALNAYQSEIRPWPHPRSEEGVRALAKCRGTQSGCGWAEAFHSIWERSE